MKSPWLRLLLSFAAVAAAFGVYRLGATPLLEPPRRAATAGGDDRYAGPLRSVERMPDLARWFPADAWELAFPQILETEHGVLLLKSYQTLDDGRLLIEPCTLILHEGSEGEASAAPPIILEAPRGAVLTFDRPLDPRKAAIGKLQSGLLQGEINIRRQGTSTSPPLDLQTRNVQIDESRIWTTQEVKFRYGQTYGSGSDLLITLPPAASLERKAKQKTAAPIRFMELVHVERIHVDLSALKSPPRAGEPAPGTGPFQGRLPMQPPRSIDVTCDGPFRIDFLQQAAAFEKNVRLTMHHEAAQVDRLSCELLAAYFALEGTPPEGAPQVDQGQKDGAPPLLPAGDQFTLKRVVATGNPVVLEAPNYRAAVRAERFEYDFQQRLLILDDAKNVMLRHDQFQVEAGKGIEYQFPRVGTVGELWAGGPGEFRGTIRPGSDQRLTASWGKRFQIQRQGEQHLLSMEGGASVRLDGTGGLRAGQLHLWLKPSPAAGGDTQSIEWEPDRMLAESRVIIESAMFQGEVERLEAWFRTAPQALPAIGQPNQLNAMSRLPAPPGSSRQPPPHSFHLTGQQARVHFLKKANEFEIDEVSVEGSVTLHERSSDRAQQPLEVSGELLVVTQAQSPAAVVRMVGNPAQLAGRGMSIRGGNLVLDRGAGTIKIATPGHMQLPITADAPLLAIASAEVPPAGAAFAPIPNTALPLPPPASERPPQQLDITWQKECVFDGRTIRFQDQVELRSGWQFASADRFAVTLDQALDFSQPRPGGARQPQLASLLLEGNVRMEQREIDPQGKLVAIQRAALPALSIDHQSGAVVSDGAGWFETVRYGSSMQGGPFPPANRAAAPEPPQLVHLKVHYARGIRGDLRSRHIRCFDQVQAIYGPVANWEQRLDLWRPETHGPRAIVVRCDQLQAAAMPQGSQQTFEMTASGNTTVQGETFVAACHRISYDGRKQLLVMEGDGRRDAEVTQQNRIGGPTSQAAARQIFFSLRDQSFQVHDAKFLDLNGPFTTGNF